MSSDDRQKITEHYSAQVAPYIEFWAPALLRFAGPLLPMIPHGSISGLDLGCGPGIITRAILDRRPGIRVIGVDMVMEMLRQARSRLPGVDLVRVDAPRLPFRDRAFDFVITTFVLQHVREQPRALSEAFRTLKPGGTFLSVSWGANDPGCGAFEVWEETLMEFGGSKDDPDPAPRWDDAIKTEAALRSLVSSADFTVTHLSLGTPSYTWTAETLEGSRLHLGAPGRRFRALPASRQEAFVKEARRRLRALEPEDFVWEPEVILAAGVRE